MSRDLLTSQLRSSNIIGNNNLEDYPKLLLYSNIDAADNEGTKSQDLSEYLSDSDNFPADTFALFYGDTTLDAITEVIPNPAANSTVFASDTVIQGTLFVNVLRDIDGNLIRFGGSSEYSSTYNQDGIDLTVANTAEEADAILAQSIAEDVSSLCSLWRPDGSDSLELTHILDGNTGCFAIDLQIYEVESISMSANEIVINSYTTSDREDAVDKYFEIDDDGNIVPK